MKVTKSVATLMAALSLASLAACSQSEGDSSAKSESATTQAAAKDTDKAADSKSTSAKSADTADASAASGDAGSATMGGSYEATVDGKAIEVDDPTIVCQEAAGMMNLAVGSGNAGLSAQLTVGDAPTVKAVGMMDGDGNAVAYAEGSPMGSAQVTKDGDTYTVTGEGIVTDINNPMSMETKPFELKITCG